MPGDAKSLDVDGWRGWVMSGGASSVEAFKGPYKGGSGQEMNFELLGMAPSAVFGLACRGHQGPGDASGI